MPLFATGSTGPTLAGVDWLMPFGPVNPPFEKAVALLPSREEDGFERCCRLEQKEMLQRAQACLPQRARLILQLYYEQEMTMKCLKKGFRIDEVPAHEYHREFGRSVISLRKVWFRYVWSFLIYLR